MVLDINKSAGKDIPKLDQITEVRPSATHGLGIFAKVDLPQDFVWWRASAEHLFVITRTQYETFCASTLSPVSENLRLALMEYGFYVAQHDQIFVLTDNARYTNHSSTPNSRVAPDDPLASITTRPVRAGEELVEDYARYDRCPWAALYGDLPQMAAAPLVV